MNPVFWLLVVLAAIAVWFLGSFIFYPFGKYLYRVWKDAMNEIERDDKEDEDE